MHKPHHIVVNRTETFLHASGGIIHSNKDQSSCIGSGSRGAGAAEVPQNNHAGVQKINEIQGCI